MANEKRLIDANALIKQFDGYGWGGECDGETVLDAVANAPTVDAVEVVRCKDCKHYVLQACACRHDNFNGIISMDGFCSYGERKDNEKKAD